MKYNILVVDDDKNLRESLRCALERENCVAISCSDGLSALSALSENEKSSSPCSIDLIIADIMMPRMDGIELLRVLRGSGNAIPFVFLTSRDEEFDRVLGLELGADDYLSKPFSIRELLARVKAILRRIERVRQGAKAAEARIVRQDELVMDMDCMSASWNDRELKLTLTEFRLLSSMAAAPGRVKTREQLLADAYPDDSYISDRAVDCHIKRLRRKLSDVNAPEDMIETVYGLGYRYNRSLEASNP
jgi:DNA-binding response OmpR family regulator